MFQHGFGRAGRPFPGPSRPGALVLAAALGGILILALALGGGTIASAAPPKPPVSDWLSADTVLYAELPHPEALLDRARDKRLVALTNTIPGFAKALEAENVRQLTEVVKVVSDRLGKPWDEAFAALTGGGAVLAVEAPDGGQKAAVVLVVTPSDEALLQRASTILIELARRDAADKGRPDPIKTGTHRGTTGYAVGEAAYAIVAGRLVLANRPEVLRAVVDRSLDGLKSGHSIESVPAWKARRDASKAKPDGLAWGFARLDRLRVLDPKRFLALDKPDAGGTILFGGWLEVLRKAPWIAADLSWSDRKLAADLTMPSPKDPRGGPFKGFVPPAGSGAPKLLSVPGSILTTSLWRDLSALWEARAELLKPEEVQNLAQLDGVAGQFFGGRDFGSGVLGATTADWRLVVALQDPKTLRPTPDVKLPAFALVVDLQPDDDDFAQRLKVAFQSFIGLANLGAAQTKAPPLELLSESFEGVTIATTRFMPPPPNLKDKDKDKDQNKDKDKKEGEKDVVHSRHNYSPSAVQVGRHFVIGSSLALTRDLVSALKAGDAQGPGKPEEGTLVAEADGQALARLVDLNRQRLVMQNILDKGNDQARAEGEVELLAALLRYLNHGRLAVQDGAEFWRTSLSFDLEH